MVLSVSQRNNCDFETLLRPAARRIFRLAAFRLFFEMSLTLSQFASREGGKFVRLELLFLLPQCQCHRRQLPRQRQACHFRAHPLIQSRLISTLTRFSACSVARCIFQHLLEFWHVHRIEAARGDDLPSFADHPIHYLMIRTCSGNDGHSAVRLELPLGAKTMRCAEKSKQQRGAQRPGSRHTEQDLIIGLTLALRENFLLGRPAQFGQLLQLLKEHSGTESQTLLCQLVEPRLKLIRLIAVMAVTIDAVSAINRFASIHHARRIGNQVLIGTHKVFQVSLFQVAFVKGFERSHLQQLCRINPITFVASLDQLVVAWIINQYFFHHWPQQCLQPSRLRTLFHVNVDGSAQVFEELADQLSVGRNDALHRHLPRRIDCRDDNSCFMNIQTHILYS